MEKLQVAGVDVSLETLQPIAFAERHPYRVLALGLHVGLDPRQWREAFKLPLPLGEGWGEGWPCRPYCLP
jgi:hypothetical protein